MEPLEWFDPAFAKASADKKTGTFTLEQSREITTSGPNDRVPARPELVEGCEQIKIYRIIIKGPGFLRYMIRRIVGACLEVASRDSLTLNDLQKALEEKNPLQLLPTAPAKGLMLWNIEYKE